MTRYDETTEGMTDGQTLATGGGFQVVGTVVARTTAAVTETLGFSFEGGGTSTASRGVNLGSGNAWGRTIALSVEWNGDTPTPTGTSRWLNTYQSPGSSSSPCIVAETDGTFTLRNASLAVVATSPTKPAGVDLEFRLYAETDAAGTAGKIGVQTIRKDTGAVWWETMLTGQSAGTGLFYAYFRGKPTAGNWSSAVLLGRAAMDTTATTFLPIVAESPNPQVYHSADGTTATAAELYYSPDGSTLTPL